MPASTRDTGGPLLDAVYEMNTARDRACLPLDIAQRESLASLDGRRQEFSAANRQMLAHFAGVSLLSA